MNVEYESRSWIRFETDEGQEHKYPFTDTLTSLSGRTWRVINSAVTGDWLMVGVWSTLLGFLGLLEWNLFQLSYYVTFCSKKNGIA